MTKYLLTLLLSSVVGFSSSASATSDLKTIIAEMEKVQTEKAQIVTALKDAKTRGTVSAVIGGTSAAIMGLSFAYSVVEGFGSAGLSVLSAVTGANINPQPSALMTVINSKGYYITLSAIAAGGAASAVYFKLQANQYQEAIDALELDLQRLTKEISSLQAAAQ